MSHLKVLVFQWLSGWQKQIWIYCWIFEFSMVFHRFIESQNEFELEGILKIMYFQPFCHVQGYPPLGYINLSCCLKPLHLPKASAFARKSSFSPKKCLDLTQQVFTESAKLKRRRQCPFLEGFTVPGSTEHRAYIPAADSFQHVQQYYLAHHGVIFKQIFS